MGGIFSQSDIHTVGQIEKAGKWVKNGVGKAIRSAASHEFGRVLKKGVGNTYNGLAKGARSAMSRPFKNKNMTSTKAVNGQTVINQNLNSKKFVNEAIVINQNLNSKKFVNDPIVINQNLNSKKFVNDPAVINQNRINTNLNSNKFAHGPTGNNITSGGYRKKSKKSLS
jgi:hypothetical protein